MNHLKKCAALFLFSLPICYASAQVRGLDYFLQRGLDGSPVLKELSNQIQATRLDSLIVRAEYLPQVNFNTSAMYAPVINGYGYSDPVTNGQVLTGTVSVSQKIFNKKTRENDLEKYGIENRSLANTSQITREDLQKAITDQYLAAYSAWKDCEYQTKVLKTMKEEEQILKKWTEAGTYRQNDYLAFKIEISSVERQIRDLDIQYRKELSNLSLLCGIPDTSAVDLELPGIVEKNGHSTETSPLFRKFEIDSLRIRNERIGIEQKYKPAINWFSDAGLVNNQPKYLYQNFGISLGIGLTLPLYDGQQKKLSFDKLQTTEETRKSYRDYFLIQYDLKLKQLHSELEKVRQLSRETEEQIRMTEELAAQDRVLMNSGSIPVTDYILALKNLLETRHIYNLYQIREQYLINEINYWKQ